MEKRALSRHRTQASVACSNLTALSTSMVFEGVMQNCSGQGTCIELNHSIREGTIVMVKATAWEIEEPPAALPEGFRTLSVAEVKWSKPLADAAIYNYAVGLRYLPN